MSATDGDPNEADSRELAAQRSARRLARVAELWHSVNYYSPEIDRFRDDGFRGWWHAYMAYRSAPMGPVDAPLVTAAFYNFAPRMIERAVPGVWEILTPDAVLNRRNDLVAEAFDRIFDPSRDDSRLGPLVGAMDEAADLAQAAVEDLDVGSRPLAAALSGLAWPDGPAMRLWHACTIMREHRGDSHNIALAAAGISGVQSHLFMAASGHGNQPTITGIRGWTEQEWIAAKHRLSDRGLLQDDGSFTAEGDRFRAEIESTTDRLSLGMVETLGIEQTGRLFDLLVDLTDFLTENGEVAGKWPPPATLRS